MGMAFSPKADVAAITTQTTFRESRHAPPPVYVVVLPLSMPDPVVKHGGQQHRGHGASTGTFSVLTPEHEGRWRVASGASFRSIKLFLPEHLLREKARNGIDAITTGVELRDVHGVNDPTVRDTLMLLAAELSWGVARSRLLLESVADAVAGRLITDFSSLSDARETAGAALGSSAVARAQDYVEENMGDDLSLGAIAAEAGVSPHHFVRVFKAATGTTPHRYVLDRRVERSRQLLSDTDLSLAEVAFRCGFSSQSHMTAVFRRLVGVTPAKYRIDTTTIPRPVVAEG